jgi:hypothetical protein
MPLGEPTQIGRRVFSAILQRVLLMGPSVGTASSTEWLLTMGPGFYQELSAAPPPISARSERALVARAEGWKDSDRRRAARNRAPAR